MVALLIQMGIDAGKDVSAIVNKVYESEGSFSLNTAISV